jgi:thiol:disulfide interchange protein DsbD
MKVSRLRPAIALLLAQLLGLSATVMAGGPGGATDALQWNWRVEAPDKSRPDVVTLVLTADIAPGYIVYGSDFKSGLGPNPTRLRLKDGQGVEQNQPLESVNAKRRKDQTFGSEYTYFEGRAEFRQRLNIRPETTQVAATVSGQSCHEADGTCTLFNQPLQIELR